MMSPPPLPFFPGSFWFEMLPAVRGVSASIPALAGKNPFNFGFGVYKNNVAHSALGGRHVKVQYCGGHQELHHHWPHTTVHVSQSVREGVSEWVNSSGTANYKSTMESH